MASGAQTLSAKTPLIELRTSNLNERLGPWGESITDLVPGLRSNGFVVKAGLLRS